MVKLLQFFALAVSANQASSANTCLGGHFTLSGEFADGFSDDFAPAMKAAVKTMTGVSTLQDWQTTVAINFEAAAGGDCAAAIAASPEPVWVPPADNAARNSTSNSNTDSRTDSNTDSRTDSNTDSNTDSRTDSNTDSNTGGASTGPSTGPNERLLLDDIVDMDDAWSSLTRQLAGHGANENAYVSYTVIADEADMAAIQNTMTGHNAATMLSVVNTAITEATTANSALTAPTVSGSTTHTTFALVEDERVAADPNAGDGDGESAASKSALAWFGLTLTAAAALV